MFTSLVTILLLGVAVSNFGEAEAGLQVQNIQPVDQHLQEHSQELDRKRGKDGKKGKKGGKGKSGKFGSNAGGNNGGLDAALLAGAGGLAAGGLAGILGSTLLGALTSSTSPDVAALITAAGGVDQLVALLTAAAAAGANSG